MKSCYRQGVSHAKESGLGRRAEAAMSAFVGLGEEEERNAANKKVKRGANCKERGSQRERNKVAKEKLS